MSHIIQTITNSNWETKKLVVSVITPVYNRNDTIMRALRSIADQTFKDFEYIIVDDGSTDDTASIIKEYLEKVSFPMMFIQKENGGVHTARNAAIKRARGRVYCCLDSDDEFLPDGLQKLWQGWESIPINKRNEYFEVKARVLDQDGNEVGPRFPKSINGSPWEEIKEYYESISAEHVGLRRLDIMKVNLWPEPEGVSFVGENIIWYRLRERYKTWLINDCVQVYHMEGIEHLDVSLSKNNRSIVFCNNMFWNITYTLNHWKLYGKRSKKIKIFFSRELMKSVLMIKKHSIPNITLESRVDRLFSIVLSVPAFFAGLLYCKIRLSQP